METILNFLKEISDVKLFAIAFVVIFAMILFRAEIGKKISEKEMRIAHKPNKTVLYSIIGVAVLSILIILFL